VADEPILHKFFTNQHNNKLSTEINRILENDKNLACVDFLVGYIRLSGLKSIIDNMQKFDTRILVGLKSDQQIYEATNIQKDFSNTQIESLNDDYVFVEKIQKLIKEKKLQIKITKEKNVHAKLYIFSNAKQGQDLIGSLIIGSSNLTYNGLEKSFELNTQINDIHYVKDALIIFEELWLDSVELSYDDIDKYIKPNIKKPDIFDITKEGITPYQLYIKLLIEYFGDDIDFLNENNIFVPKQYKKLAYQVEAVNNGIKKLQEHNGFFLSDVVGLGKTIVVAMLIKKLSTTFVKEVLIVVPPAVKIQWTDTFNEFKITDYTIVSHASLENIDKNRYELVVVDESHKFRNKKTTKYELLSNICLNKKVILLSATPQNNSPQDLFNQIALFQETKNSTLVNCTNLHEFFDKKEAEYQTIIKNKNNIDTKKLRLISTQIREKVIKDIMIRRTRYDIENHNMYKDENFKTPKVIEPFEHNYKLKGKLSTIFEHTAIQITQNIKYSRFNALSYIKYNKRKEYYPKANNNIFDFNPLSGLMKTVLVKRLESSFEAFKISIARHLSRYNKLIENYGKDEIYLGKNSNDILDFDTNDDIDYDDMIDELIKKGKVKHIKKNDFESCFIDDLKEDQKIFEQLVENWKDIDDDPKLDKFKEIIENDKNKKLVIFTESVDTLEYLKTNLINKKIVFITSKNRKNKQQTIRENFDANYDIQKDDYDILVTTDTLAEGINLHRANTIYNYDIPWNATKLIQRIGRVNRIGTKADEIYIHNFKPASHIEDIIKLSQKAFVKLQAGYDTYGEDNKIYTKDETVGSVNLFEEYKKQINEKDEEIDFLEELREFRQNKQDEFAKLKALGLDLKICIKNKTHDTKTYIYLKNHNQNIFYKIQDKTVDKIDFLTIATNMKTISTAKSTATDSLSDRHIDKAVNDYKQKLTTDIQIKNDNKSTDINDNKAKRKIKKYFQEKIIDNNTYDKAYRLLDTGADILLAKEIQKSNNLNIKDIIDSKSFVNKPKQTEQYDIDTVLSVVIKDK